MRLLGPFAKKDLSEYASFIFSFFHSYPLIKLMAFEFHGLMLVMKRFLVVFSPIKDDEELM